MQERLQRGAGILLPISSLPSPYGIGSLGSEAFSFVDFLCKAGQTYWQVLPVGPTGYGDSPYQSFSAFAGNPYFIDLPLLAKQGLLTADELKAAMLDSDVIAYDRIYDTRFSVLRLAAKRFVPTAAFFEFCENEDWLADYARYMALKTFHGEREWTTWEKPYRDREDLENIDADFAVEIRFWQCCQYWFFEQWAALKCYANERGVNIIGDIPIYVSQDSADVWAHRELFLLDSNGHPTVVAGVPPDYFSENGQRWGNPLYHYERMANDGFAWWRARMTACARLYDVVRIDHFIGIARYFAIPAACETAKDGVWCDGPGVALTDVFDSVGGAKILAEDLGVVHDSARQLLYKTGYAGMKVLLFAFDGNPENEYLPHRFQNNCVVYGGTHDNQTVVGFCQTLAKEKQGFLLEYLGARCMCEVPKALMRAAYASVADVAIFQMQDVLELDNSARMNVPSTIGGNWQWRLCAEQTSDDVAVSLKRLAKTYGR